MTPPERGGALEPAGLSLKSPRFLSRQRGPSQMSRHPDEHRKVRRRDRGFHFELRESSGCRGTFGGPVEARAGEELDGAVLDPRRHAIADEFDFVDS